MGFLGGLFWGGNKSTPPPLPPSNPFFWKLVRIMLESWNLVRKFTHICSCKKYTFQYQGFLNKSRIRLLNCCKSAINWKNNNDAAICRHDLIMKLFWRRFISLVKCSYYSKFHFNIITGFWSYNNYFSLKIDQKSGNWKYHRLILSNV